MAAEQAVVSASERLKVFVSYSRTDLDFADQLVLALEDKGFEALVDRHDIDAAEKWKDRLGALITSCDTVVFVLSEKSAGSPICQWEVEEAAGLAKRIIPVVPHDPSGVPPPPQLAELNYIHFFKHPNVPGSGFYDGVQKLDRALRVNLSWLRRQTAYAEQAALWGADKSDDRVLGGKPLEEALAWRASAPKGAAVASLVLDYLAAGEAVAARRKAEADANIAERERAIKRARRATMVGIAVAAGLTLIALIGNVFAGYFALKNVERRSAQFAQQSLTLTADADRPLAILIALEGDPAARRGWLERLFDRDGFSPARDALATGVGHNREQRVFAVGSGINSVAFSPDGQRVLAGAEDGKARLFAVSGGAALAMFDVGGSVQSVAFSSDGQQVLIGSGDGKTRIFAASGGPALGEMQPSSRSGGPALATFRQTYGGLRSTFSPDGQRVLASTNGNTALLFRTSSGAAPATFYVGGFITVVRFSPDSQHVLIGSDDGKANMFAATDGARQATFDVGGSVRSVAFSPDGQYVLAGTNDGKVQLFASNGPHLLRGRPVSETPALATFDVGGSVSSVAFSPDGQNVLTGSSDGKARLFAVSDGPALATFDAGSFLQSIAFSHNGQYVLTGSYEGQALLFAASGGPALARFGEGSVTSVAFSRDGQRVLIGSYDGKAGLFAASGGPALATFDVGQFVLSGVFSPDGQRVLIGSTNGKARLFAASGGSALATFDTENWSCAAFSPDGQHVLTASGDGKARLFAASGGPALVTFDVGHSVRSIAFSPDGQRVLLASSGTNTARLFAVSGGAALATFDEGGSVESAAFSPDGQHVLTGSGDGKARLFAPSGGPALVTFDVGANIVSSVAFSPDGEHMLIGSLDGEVLLRAVPRIVLASAGEQVGIGCEMLHDMSVTGYTDEDLARFPILRNERRDPCAGVPPPAMH